MSTPSEIIEDVLVRWEWGVALDAMREEDWNELRRKARKIAEALESEVVPKDRAARCERVVRALAAVDPMNYELSVCTVCAGFDEITDEPQDHTDDCPWRLAVELTAEMDA